MCVGFVAYWCAHVYRCYFVSMYVWLFVSGIIYVYLYARRRRRLSRAYTARGWPSVVIVVYTTLAEIVWQADGKLNREMMMWYGAIVFLGDEKQSTSQSFDGVAVITTVWPNYPIYFLVCSIMRSKMWRAIQWYTTITCSRGHNHIGKVCGRDLLRRCWWWWWYALELAREKTRMKLLYSDGIVDMLQVYSKKR